MLKDDLEAYYYKARDSAISNAVDLLYGKGALGPPLCKAATTLGENLEQSYAKALEVRNGNMFSTFKEAGDLACKLEWGIDEVVAWHSLAPNSMIILLTCIIWAKPSPR